ncbi:MAG: hypothetical protein MI862_07870 [Desulfobacterales bacterium]|nr:hypothetical protein [Desulfobacterales bacterium]
MKYVYYIVAIVVLFSALAAYGLFDTRLEISEPVLSVNDRIFSKAELDRLMEITPPDMTREEFIESLIEKQLLIQEAIRQDINREENFRLSVQNFYEQSLIKILLDRKQESITVDVTNQEIARYEELSRKKVTVSKLTYPSMTDLKNRTGEKTQTIAEPFINLSQDLKFILLNLNPGDSSNPKRTRGQGGVIYRLEEITDLELTEKDQVNAGFDVKKVSLFLRDKKREQVVETWLKSIRDAADIWREE